MQYPPWPKNARPASTREFVAFIIAYSELLVARWESADRGCDVRARAIPLAQFGQWNVKEEVLLWMLYQGHVNHLHLRSADEFRDALAQPLPRPAASVLLTPQSCFVLNEQGAAFADALLRDVLVPKVAGAFEAAWGQLLVGVLVPFFDRAQRLFAWGGHVLKQFRQPAANQELILAAAEELAWPEWFDDPLPRGIPRNPKVRLHDTIKDLNRNQTTPLIHFRGDGSGRRVGWEYR